MDKQEIKAKLLEALRSDRYFAAVRSLWLFGSYVNGEPSDTSDVDVLIDFEPTATIGFFELFDIKSNLESFVGRAVDLLTPQAISKYFRDEVLAQAERIYEKR